MPKPNSMAADDNLVCAASPKSVGVSLQLQNKFLKRTCLGVAENRARTLDCGAHKVIIAQDDRLRSHCALWHDPR